MRPTPLRALGLLVLSLAPAAALAQYPAVPDTVAGPLLEPAPNEEANHAADPNRVPYETETGAGEAVLAFPATVWRGFADAFGAGVLWAEEEGHIERALGFFGPSEAPRRHGISPVLSVGGRDGLVIGAIAYHNDVFGTGRYARVGGRFGFGNTHSAQVRFLDPSLLGSGLHLLLSGDYEFDSEERFYMPGNDAGEDDRIPYERRRVEGDVAVAFPLPAHLRLGGDVDLKYVDVSRDEDHLNPPPIPGFGAATLLSGGAYLAFDRLRRGGLDAPRTYAGTLVALSYRYGADVEGRPLAYHRLGAEVQQFVPIPFLPPDRRLALRARYEKTHPPDDHKVPFYELAELGGPNSLRAFRNDRFRDEGLVLLQMEYRYPIWTLLDALLFADAGQVFYRYEDLALSEFHGDLGFGVHVYGLQDAAGRLEVAFGPEGTRVLLQVGVAF